MNTKTKITIITSTIILAIIFIFYAITQYSSPEAVWARTLESRKQEISENEKKITELRDERRKLANQDETLSGSINELKARNTRIQECNTNGILRCEENQKSLIPAVSARELDYDGNSKNLPQGLNGNATPASGEPGRNEVQCTIGTGSHDVRPLAKNYPGVAGWKNNNPSDISLGSKSLEKAFDDASIQWFVGTARPANEGSHYYGFPDLENGMKAKLLIIRRSYKNHTIASYLRTWGTDEVLTNLSRTRTIGSLSDSEIILLIKPQIRKESGKDFADFIFKNVLICK